MIVLMMAVGCVAGVAGSLVALVLGLSPVAIVLAYPAGGVAGIVMTCTLVLTVPTVPRPQTRLLQPGLTMATDRIAKRSV